MAYVSRDVVARTEVHREVVSVATGMTCSWCGGLNAHGKLYVYRTETDGGRRCDHRGLFCSAGCHSSYHS